jgi:hypothetical protein
MAPWLDWVGRRSRLLVLALAGLILVEFRTHQALVVNLATVGAFLVALWFSLPTRSVVQGELDGAALRLRKLVRKNWRDRRFVLMGESDAATVAYVRQQGLESGTVVCDWTGGDVNNIYERYREIGFGRMMLLGPPGSGKTLAAITLVMDILSRGLAAPDERMLPIPISIVGWDGTQRLGDWLSDRLVEGYRIARPVAKALIYNDYILPVLDGLDEVDDQASDEPSSSKKILQQIRSSSDAADIAHGALVMTCRSDFYGELYESGNSLRNAVVVEMKDLQPEEVRSYLRLRFKDDRAHDPYRSESFAAAAKDNDSCLIRALSVPLILTLAILVLKAGYSTPQRLARYKRVPYLRNHLFQMLIPSAVETNLRRPLPRIAGGVRKKQFTWRPGSSSRYDPDDVRVWLLNIATERRNGRLHPVKIYPAHLWRLAEENTVRKIHLALGLMFGLAAAGLASELLAVPAGYLATAVTGVAAVAFALWAGMLQYPKPRRLSFRQFATPTGLLRVITIMILGGLCALGGALDGGWKTALTSGVGGTIAFTVIVGLIGGIPEVVDPRYILRNDLLFGSLAGFGVAIAAALPGGLTGGVSSDLNLNKYLSVTGSACLAIVIAIPAGVTLGSRCWTRHALMTLKLAPKRQVPWRTMYFIRWCYLANLLRVSGTEYELRHQEIMQGLHFREPDGQTGDM